MSFKNDCLFCKIVKKEIPAKIVGENSYAIAFLDINPISVGHLLVIPKNHFDNFVQCDQQSLLEVSLLAQKMVTKLSECCLKPQGFNFISNLNKIAGQEINHFHLHVIPKYIRDEGLNFNNNIKLNMSVDESFKVINES